MMFEDLLSTLLGTFSGFVLGAAVCTLVEFLFEAEPQSFASRIRGFCFSFLALAAATIATSLSQSLMAGFELRPLLQIDLAGAINSDNLLVVLAGYTVVPLTGVFLYDVGYYCFHRLQHTVPFLWRFHALHHSIEELNAFNSYHHVSEYFLRIPLMTLPLSMLVWISEPQVVVTGTIIGIVGTLAHANTRLRFGPLRYLVVEPAYHRIHHSLEERHWNRNYAFYFPILDVLFRTSYFPATGEIPKTGVNYVREARTVRDFLILPAPPRKKGGLECHSCEGRDPGIERTSVA